MKRLLACVFLFTGLMIAPPHPVHGQAGIVNAILFYNPDQSDSRELFNTLLPEILTEQGDHLLLLTVDATRDSGRALYETAVSDYRLSTDEAALPLAVLGDQTMSGLPRIERDFSARVSALPSADWPNLHGMDEILQKAGIIQAPQDAWSIFLHDQPGNTLALVVLVLLAVSLIYSGLAAIGLVKDIFVSLPGWTFLALIVLGLIVSSYLSYTEMTHSEVACGGISHCTAVQDSPYSMLLGIIPMGLFGVLGNLAILAAWTMARFTRGRMQDLANLAKCGFAFFGAGYSAYLTFLEPFVIGATCLWCLTSAIVMALILPCTVAPVRSMIAAVRRSASST